MGIVNCTPDSFSDGGRFLDEADAIAEAERQLSDGATIVDVGGESTRPGAAPVSADDERRRVIPVLSELRRRHPETVLSVDTTKVSVAAAALAVGVDVVNDVSAAAEPGMLELVAGSEAALILMHRRGTPETMQNDTRYDHVVAEVHGSLRDSAERAAAAGIHRDRIWLDPGIGFGKDDAGNLALMAALPDLATSGHPIVLGPSRKSFIGRLTGAGVDDRLPGTLASLIPVIGLERAVVRVHDPAAAIQFLEIAQRLVGAAA
jgi:dihydropteroate synthase